MSPGGFQCPESTAGARCSSFTLVLGLESAQKQLSHICSLAVHAAQTVAQQWEKASSCLAPGQDQHSSCSRAGTGTWDTQPALGTVAVASPARGNLRLRGYRILGRICSHSKPSCKSLTLRRKQGRAPGMSWMRAQLPSTAWGCEAPSPQPDEGN